MYPRGIMKKEKKVIYYSDELSDEFAGDHITARKIDGSYAYLREGWAGKLLHIFWYRIIAVPLAFCYMKLHFHHKIINKKVLKKAGKDGCFMYGNHTHFLADALIPTMVNHPRRVRVIVHPNNVSMPVLGRITPYLGALPLPDDTDAARNFIHAVAASVGQGCCVMIYPEAHIWPYYTKIRPFQDLSFRYPVTYQTPVFTLTNTYRKRRFRNCPQIVTYIDGPFYPDRSLTNREQKKQLRDLAYEKMQERAKQNNMEIIRYVRRADAGEQQ